MIVFSVCFDSQKNSNKDGKNKHRQKKKKTKSNKEGKRNLSGDEGGNCYNIYKHEIYISIAASYAVMLLLFDDVVCLWRQLRSHTDVE